ncbi:MAG: hypothetical protein ACRDUY_14200 [Nitriliruptorales bacterium]
MPQVELLSALVFDHETWDEAAGAIDPAIRVRGDLPGYPRAFVVDRVYRAAQGWYDESFALLDPDGEVVHQQDYARISLRGQMFEDRFRDVVRPEAQISGAGDHTMVFLIADRAVGRIPDFIVAPDSTEAAGVLGDALEATLKKSAIVWLQIPQPRGGSVVRPAWFVYRDGRVFVLTGPDEQDLTNIDQAEEVTLIARSKEIRSRIGSVPAAVRIVDRESDEFDEIAQLGLMTRLNLPDGMEAALARWKDSATLVELTPQT